MKNLLITLLGGIILTTCQAASTLYPTATPSVFACTTSGSVQMLTLEETARGYTYHYSLYLPPCYENDPERLYPLLIHIPGRGGSPGDFINAGGASLADMMILNSEIPPFILITTENTDSDSEKYGESILNDLLPYIESHYRVNPDRQYHAVFGVSLGGITTYRLVFQHPQRFASAALFGSGAIAGEEEQIRSWLSQIKSETVRVFFDSGEEDAYMLDQARAMTVLLDEAGISFVLNSGDGGHSYDYWMKNMPLYFRWVAEDW